MRVFVYFNLHRKCLSVKALEGERKGRVIAHAKAVELVGVTFKVSEAGRQRKPLHLTGLFVGDYNKSQCDAVPSR